MASKKNVWRGKAGGLQFRRETKRYSDGTPWGKDVLYIRVKGKFCFFLEPFDWGDVAPNKTIALFTGTYSAASPIQAAKIIRAKYLSVKERS